MAGKRGTTKPITILVHPDLLDTAQVLSHIEQGHEVVEMTQDAVSYDLIIGPNCWRMNNHLIKWLGEAVKAMRSVKVRRAKKK